MRFDIDRMCNLAGLGKSRSSASTSGLIRESAHDEGMRMREEDHDEGMGMREEDSMYADLVNEMDHFEEEDHMREMDHFEEEDDMDEEVEVDEAVLVQELRRMRKIMSEAKNKAVHVKRRRKENLQEAQLKAVIDQEVKNVLKDLNLSSGWMYGNNKPTRSRKGYLNHGSFLKGIGFK